MMCLGSDGSLVVVEVVSLLLEDFSCFLFVWEELGFLFSGVDVVVFFFEAEAEAADEAANDSAAAEAE